MFRKSHRSAPAALRKLPALPLLAALLLSLLSAAPASAVDPYTSWNFLHDKQIKCHPMSVTRSADQAWRPPLRYANFDLIDGADGDNGYDVPRPTHFHNGDCTSGLSLVRLDTTEVIQSMGVAGQPRTYFHKGGDGSGRDNTEAKDYPYGHLHISDLAPGPPAATFTKAQLDANGAKTAQHHPTWGPGRACTGNLSPLAQYKITGATAPPESWVYRSGANTGAGYKKYAMTGDMYGDMSRDFQGLQWGWVGKWDWQGNQIYSADEQGFGTFRAMLPPGTIVTRCDVASYTTRAWTANTSTVIGRVTAVYVRAMVGGTELYGWIMHSYQHLTQGQSGTVDGNYQARKCVMAVHNAPDCKPDADGDGVPDASDACPNTYAQTANGCPPPPDADGDGVPDASDACPNTYAQTANGCPAPPPVNDTLWTGDTLFVDQSRTSQNGAYRLTVQQDGNLVLYGPGGPVWATGTWGSNARLVMQWDGNLVLYNGNGAVLWATNSSGSNARLVVQNDSNLVIYNGGGGAIWSRY